MNMRKRIKRIRKGVKLFAADVVDSRSWCGRSTFLSYRDIVIASK